MSVWKKYDAINAQLGSTERDYRIQRDFDVFTRKMVNSASCYHIKMDGKDQLAMITHSADMDVKKIFSLPGQHLHHGGIVDYAKNKWIITEYDASNMIYDRCLMQQCNHILRWVNKDGLLREKWCFVEDGTKYLIGERTRELLTIGDARIAVTVGKDDETVELMRGLRFLIDDTDSQEVLAYQITKSNRMMNNFNNEGVFRFILNEVELTKFDDREARIADYRQWVETEDEGYQLVQMSDIPVETETPEETEEPTPSKRGWL